MRDRAGPGWWLAALFAALLVLAVRSLGYAWSGDVVPFELHDTQYHLRRALFVFERFPRILLFDPYLGYPDGASVPWPPLFDWTLGAAARLLASDQHSFERVVAWSGPVYATLAAWPIALVARRAAGAGAASTPAVAVVVYALIPIAVGYARPNTIDHHSAVACAGAWLLWCCAALAEPALARRARARLVAVHVAVRLALMLTWPGSLLYLGIAEATLALAFAVTGRRRIAVDQAVGAAATGLLLVPVLLWLPEPLGGPYSGIALSRLHVLAMLGVASVTGSAAALAGLLPLDTPARRTAALAALAVAFAAAVLAFPGPRGGIAPAFRFLSMADELGAVTGEQTPLFPLFGRRPPVPATVAWGWLAYLVPLAPLAAWWHGRSRAPSVRARTAAYVLAGWAAAFGVLAVWQRRYGNDLAPAASVAFALGFRGAADLAVGRVRDARLRSAAATLLSLSLAIGSAWPAIRDQYRPRLRVAWAAHRGDPRAAAAARQSISGTLEQFLLRVRRITPETSGYFDESGRPEYGVVSLPSLGHAISYVARRPTPATPFSSYVAEESWRQAQAFLRATSEERALAAARALRGRYVITTPDMPRGSVGRRLHDDDGSATAERPALAHFRLLAEAPAGAPSHAALFADASRAARTGAAAAPYKLFEIVPGAVLDVPGAPGETAVATLSVRVDGGRELVYRAEAHVGADARARLRVPYATSTGADPATPSPDLPVRTDAIYHVRVGDREWSLTVSEESVRSGAVVSPSEREDPTGAARSADPRRPRASGRGGAGPERAGAAEIRQ